MSFGRRLGLFFTGIVVVPTALLAVLVLQVSRNSRDGKADARLGSTLDTARAIYDDALRSAPEEAERIVALAGPVREGSDQTSLSA